MCFSCPCRRPRVLQGQRALFHFDRAVERRRGGCQHGFARTDFNQSGYALRQSLIVSHAFAAVQRENDVDDGRKLRRSRASGQDDRQHGARLSQSECFIAAECGFPSANYLSHLFVRKTGMSMRDYRARDSKRA